MVVFEVWEGKLRYRFNSQRKVATPRNTRSKQDIEGEKEACKLAKLIGAMVISSRKRWHGGGVQVVDIYLPEEIADARRTLAAN